MTPEPISTFKRPTRLQFGMGTLLCGIAIVAICIAPFARNALIARERIAVRSQIERRGAMFNAPCGEYIVLNAGRIALPFPRKIIGDSAAVTISLPAEEFAEMEAAQIRRTFPEALICSHEMN